MHPLVPRYLADYIQTVALSGSRPELGSADTEAAYSKPSTRTKFGDRSICFVDLLYHITDTSNYFKCQLIF